jgi:hypothetical protein
MGNKTGILKRLELLIKKFAGRKGVVFILATIFTILDKMPVLWWSFFAAVFIGVATVEKVIELVKVLVQGPQETKDK